MDRFITLALVMFAASEVILAKDTITKHIFKKSTVFPWEFRSVCPDACKAPKDHLAGCYGRTTDEPCDCDPTYAHQLNACYLCAVDSAAAGDTVSGYEDFDAKAAQASLDDLWDLCQQIDQPIDHIVFGTDVFVASSSAAPASSATASSDAISSAAAPSTTSSIPATPASVTATAVPASAVPTGNATASAPEPTKSGSARGLSSVTYTVAACAFVGALATFFL